MLNRIIYIARRIRDLPPRIRNKTIRFTRSIKPFTNSEKVSDSENLFYLDAIVKINSSDRRFQKFRRVYNYREILEHVSPTLGRSYLENIKINWGSDSIDREGILLLDTVGKPFKYFYKELGFVSPTAIRYAHVAKELESYFPRQVNGRIAEIGVGFGGQASILLKNHNLTKYTMFDLPEVFNLVDSYLGKLNLTQKIEFSDIHKLASDTWDLVISNYAFSELPRNLQIKYVKKVLMKSNSGYMIMNSGRGNLTGRSSGKMSVQEITSYIPGASIFEEIPKTSKDNYIIAWGYSK